MFKVSALLRICFSFVILAALSFSVFADTIRLKDGSIIKGRITGFTGGTFVVTIGEGARQRQMSFAAADVESIEFDSPQTAVVTRQPPASNQRVVVSNNTGVTPRPQATQRQDPLPIRQEPAAVTPPAAQAPVRASASKPVELNIRVHADNTSNGWTNSGWVVKKGQRIRIIGEGEISIGNGRRVGPSGSAEIEDTDKLLPAVPTGALIAVIGDDNNDFLYIGADREFVAARDGALFLGVNEGNLDDNAGTFAVRVEIYP
ncbi:MAG: hypothetical protein H0V76_03150 [Blastocatellia bacterium]|nr:hypothetical protein [Blastocatellia bacterium]